MSLEDYLETEYLETETVQLQTAFDDPFGLARLPITFSGTYGVILVATIINLCCYGLGLVMCVQYFRHHAGRDPIYLKITIAALITLATFEALFSAHQIFDIFVVKRGNIYLLVEIPFSVLGEYTCAYTTAFIAQLFLSSRIWSVCKRVDSILRFLAIPVGMLALLQIIAGLVQITVMGISKTYNNLALQRSIVMDVTMIQGVAAAVCDIAISVTLCTIFHMHRSGLKTTNSLVNKLILYACNRAAATSICAILSILLYYFCSGTFYFLIPLLANTHFYVISTVTVLSSREGLREEVQDQSFHLTHLGLNTNTYGEFPTTNLVQMAPSAKNGPEP